MRIHLTDRVLVEGRLGVLDERDLPRQARLVLAYLVAQRRKPVPREELAELLWPAGLPQRWEKALAALVSRLRASLADIGLDRSDAITSAFACYQLQLPEDAWVDLDAARTEIDRAEESLRAGDPSRASASAHTGAMIARRTFLPGEENAWAGRIRTEMRALLVRCLDCIADASITRGDLAGALLAAGEAVEMEPFREVGHQRLIRAHAAAGDRAEALRDYERCRVLLAEELGVDPSAETQAIYLEILRASGDPDLRIDVTSPLTEPRSNLPAARTSFVGREREAREIIALLEIGRIVTLTGVGGSGKTRLAVHVVAEVAKRSRRDVAFVDLAPTNDPQDVTRNVARALGILDPLVEARQSANASEIEDHLVRRLADHDPIIIFDNCEHLIEECARVCDLLLEKCHAVCIVATSREPLAIDGEAVYQVPPLIAPSDESFELEDVASSDAATLFLERARLVRSWFELTPQNAPAVAEICRKLEGIPLAIELAATKIGVLSPSQVAERLDDAFRLLSGGKRGTQDRHQTLGAAMDWSFDLLAEDERALFRRLAIFAGGFTLQAAEGVCAGDPVEEGEVLVALHRLVEKSLVTVEESGGASRFRLLEPVRQFAARKLAESDESDRVHERHRDWFVARAGEMRSEASWSFDQDVAAAARADRLNLAAAFDWSIHRGESQLALRMATDVSLMWRAAGWVTESAALLEEALRISDPSPSRRRAWALGLLGGADFSVGNVERSIRRFHDALTMARATGAVGVTSWVLMFLGRALALGGHIAEGLEAEREALIGHRETGDAVGIDWALQNMAWMSFAAGDYEGARACADEITETEGIPAAVGKLVLGMIQGIEGNLAGGRALAAEAGDPFLVSVSEMNFYDMYVAAMELVADGDLGICRFHLHRSIKRQRDAGHVEPLPESLELAASLFASERNLADAALVFRAADRVREETGIRMRILPWVSMIDKARELAAATSEPGALEKERSLSLSEAVDLTLRTLEKGEGADD